MPRRIKARKIAVRGGNGPKHPPIATAENYVHGPAKSATLPPPAPAGRISIHVEPKPERWFPRKTFLAVLAFAALAVLPESASPLRNYRILDWSAIPAVFDLAPHPAPVEQATDDQVPEKPTENVRSERRLALNDPAHDLDRFYEALYRTERRQGITRILHYGDSPTTADMITADVRASLQKQFGDAGHGFFLIDKPWAWYGHRGLEIHGSGWKADPANQAETRDGLFGLGGVSFRGDAGAQSEIELRHEGHTRVEIAYLAQPGGGKLRVLAGTELAGEIDTASETQEPGYAAFSIPPTATRLFVRVSGGRVRVFGASLSKPGSGVVYHSLGLNGAFVNVLSRMFKEAHWTAELQHYQPDLVVINYGTNESVYPAFIETGYTQELKEVIRRVRAAVPKASLLVMSPMDRGRRESNGEIGTVPVMPQLVSMQQRIASEAGCAFFNTFQAMGGPGTMGRWYQAEPRLVGADFIHPMPAGAKIVGHHFYQALMDGYNEYKMRLAREIAARPIDGAGTK